MGLGIAAALGGSAILGALGARQNAKAQKQANEANAALQREFAQQGIQWRVQDAEKAGIHPLYAIGANTTSAQPSFVSTQDGDSLTGLSHAALGAAAQMQTMEINAQQKRVADSQIALNNARTAVANKQATESGQPVLGTADNPIPLVTYFKTMDGNVIPLLNERAAAGMEGLGPSILSAQSYLRDFILDNYDVNRDVPANQLPRDDHYPGMNRGNNLNFNIQTTR